MASRFMIFFAMALLLSASAATAFADKAYHTERLTLELTADGAGAGHPELRRGHVVNIHPNGPQNGAIEKYMVNGAMPDISYEVHLAAFFGAGCTGVAVFPGGFATTTTLDTNSKGNAHGEVVFPPEALAPLSGTTVYAKWTLFDGAVDAYTTVCTQIDID